MATTMLNLPEELVTDIFNKVAGHSAIAKLSAQKPLPFNGIKEFVFTMPGEAALVAEGAAKPAGSEAVFTPVVIRPLKFVYQTRITDEFMHAADEDRLNYLKAFGDGFSVKIARALDIASMHGLNPKDSSEVSDLQTKCFDGVVTNVVTYVSASADDNLDAAVQTIVGNGMAVNGVAISPAFGAAMARIKVNGVVQYPEFRFGGSPASFAGYGLDMNTTVPVVKAVGQGETAPDPDQAIIGDFANAFRWGYAKNVPLKVIEYGDPDGAGRDLQLYNEVCLRAEAYIGWGILDKDSFAIIR